MQTTISSKGQITVPASVREALGLVPGTKIQIALGPDGAFTARKVPEEDFFAQFVGSAPELSEFFKDGQDAMEFLRGPVEPGDLGEET